ncbi:fungal-specific transcription factor domain-containing protein [Stachybotrys elegans]|uniref:Fungal-specific transcription factor domain-containing protein n=1 Tax=Stachybotrys elegans TaxID=80388 RepID=A0A8K0SHT2_9HYPO|nr:fungal-specific transcription factor domain-containing protein [Stachybotrys elegans]
MMQETAKLPTRNARPRPPLPNKRCWTCIDRKIRCDRHLPVCSNCIRSGRVCQGYGVRLSWPREDDGKRFIVHPVADSHGSKSRLGRSKEVYMVHTTSQDVQLYYCLTSPGHTKYPVHKPILWPLHHLSTEKKSLFQYFQTVIAPTLSTLSDRPLGPVLVRIALSANSPSGLAVQQAVLAFASLHRYGPQVNAVELKLSCLRALSAATSQDMEPRDIIHHVAAGMLLCKFEILQHFAPHRVLTNDWIWYISGAKKLINSTPIDTFDQEGDLLALIESVSYHESLYSFSRSHWQPRQQVDASDAELPFDAMKRVLQPKAKALTQQQALRMIVQICSTLRPPSDPLAQTDEYKGRVKRLGEQAEREWAAAYVPDAVLATASTHNRGPVVRELYHLAALIYLGRAAGPYLVDADRITPWVRRGFRLLGALETCDRTMLLAVIGGEARTDEERMAIIDILAATETSHPVRMKDCIWNLMHALWSHDDLHAEKDLPVDYREKFTSIVSMFPLLPPFE